MSLVPRRSCLGDALSEYAAGRLGDAAMRRWDRHLVACEVCRRAVADERRLQLLFATAQPAVPGGLRSSLLAMGAASAVTPAADGPTVPDVPSAPFSLNLSPADCLPVVRPSAPALHRSALRSAVMATVVAGASAAAAWGLGVTTTGGPSPSPGVRTVVPASAELLSGGSPGASGGSPGAGVPSDGGTAGPAVPATFRRTLPQPGMLTMAPAGAQSSP